jgi:hypothetical protein
VSIRESSSLLTIPFTEAIQNTPLSTRLMALRDQFRWRPRVFPYPKTLLYPGAATLANDRNDALPGQVGLSIRCSNMTVLLGGAFALSKP